MISYLGFFHSTLDTFHPIKMYDKRQPLLPGSSGCNIAGHNAGLTIQPKGLYHTGDREMAGFFHCKNFICQTLKVHFTTHSLNDVAVGTNHHRH